MKKLVLIVFVFCVAGFVFGAPLPDASDLGNAFHAFGNCEGGAIFVQPGRDGTTILTGQSEDPSGAVNKCLKIVNDTDGTRIEGSTANQNITYAGLTGTDVVCSFYLKGGVGDKLYSYPRFALRQDPIGTGGYEETNNCTGYCEWTNESTSPSSTWPFDGTWKQYSIVSKTPKTNTLVAWDTVTTGDFFTNDYFDTTTQTLYLDEIVLRDPTPKDASDDPANAFASFGDCEGDVWVQLTVACSVPNFLDAQTTATGVVGLCCKLDQPSAYDRANASTLDASTLDLIWGNDAVLKFYYKSTGGLGTTYPWIYFRQNITNNNASLHPDGGATKVANWNAAGSGSGIGHETIIRDGAWHLLQPDISDFNWSGQTADLALNLLGLDPGAVEFYIDEIYLTDPTPPSSRVNDWGLF